MEEYKKTKTEDKRYFDELLKKIREIRSSERSASAKIADILILAGDYKSDESADARADFSALVDRYNYADLVKLAHYIIHDAESYVMSKKSLSVASLLSDVHKDMNSIMNNQGIYDFPSFVGEYVVNEEGNEQVVFLPDELKNFKGRSMVLRIEDMERFVDTFCSCDTYYRRAYAILADLDKKILECLETGEFPRWTDVEYKDWGIAMFEFSHFEVDLREPDENYRTLYVVYRYDTTAS